MLVEIQHWSIMSFVNPLSNFIFIIYVLMLWTIQQLMNMLQGMFIAIQVIFVQFFKLST